MVDPRILGGRLGNQLFQLAFLYSQMKEGKVPDIYVQDYRYFDKYRDEIKQWMGTGIGYLPYVAIHLRVGSNPLNPDEPKYLENPFYVPLAKTGYYIDAVNKFPGRKFLVFSDDIPFAKTYFEGDKFAFDDSKDDIEAFNRMASCDSFVIANSSFSFMAAYLSPFVAKKVVAPGNDKWFNNRNSIPIPPEWERV